jgi:hypothetical protein
VEKKTKIQIFQKNSDENFSNLCMYISYEENPLDKKIEDNFFALAKLF